MKAAFLFALVPALVSAQDVQLPLSGDRCANAIALDALSALSVLQPAEVLEAWQDMGVVDLLKEVGDDCGLEEERLVEVFGEGEARWCVDPFTRAGDLVDCLLRSPLHSRCSQHVSLHNMDLPTAT